MKTPLEIEIRKVRKQLSIYGVTEKEKAELREKLAHLKIAIKEERKKSG